MWVNSTRGLGVRKRFGEGKGKDWVFDRNKPGSKGVPEKKKARGRYGQPFCGTGGGRQKKEAKYEFRKVLSWTK